jgi:hypothetical protein
MTGEQELQQLREWHDYYLLGHRRGDAARLAVHCRHLER